MKNKIFFIAIILSCGCVSIATEHEPDIKASEDIAMKGTSTGVTACFACHGTRTEENKSGAFPRFVNQSQFYISNQLRDYANGTRANAVMSPIAKALSNKEREDVAIYYAKILFPTPKVKKPAAAIFKRGEELAKLGDQKIELQACNNCHGPDGVGLQPGIPSIAGQHANYLTAQINAWKDGQRKNSMALMSVIAKKLSDKDIAALAAYFEQVQINVSP